MNNSWSAVLVAVFVFAASIAQERDVVVSTVDGKLRGVMQMTVKRRLFYAFYNIPYARPPVDEYRFKEPKPGGGWSGVRDATTPGAPCLQHISQSFLTTGREDCLYLNIFTPTLPNASSITPWLPVIVFFHDGVFMSGDPQLAGPGYLLDADLILVTVNYRLGILGFMSTGDAVVPGNNGLKDQVAALRWLNVNIEVFGGDTRRITLAGNTAGAVAVHLHYLSPLSRDLFQQGIAASGSALVPWAIAHRLPEKTRFVANTLGCPVNDSSLMVQCLRTFSPKQLILFTQNYEAFINTPFAPFGPCVEREGKNAFLTEHPRMLLQKGMSFDRPLVFSDCGNEGLYPLAEIIDDEMELDFLNQRWKDVGPYLLNFNDIVTESLKPQIAQEIRDHYINGEINASSALRVIKLFGDRQFLSGNGQAAGLQAKHNLLSPVYFYYFTYRGQNSLSEFYNPSQSGNYGSANGDDMLYILQDKIGFFNESSTPEDLRMRDLMVNIWASFATTGRPSMGGGGGVPWLPVGRYDYDLCRLTCLEVAAPDRLSYAIRQDFGERIFWSQLPFGVLTSIGNNGTDKQQAGLH